MNSNPIYMKWRNRADKGLRGEMITSIHAQLSDTIADVYCHDPLDFVQEPTYELRFLDIPTGRTYTISYTSESDCVLSFAAWLAADQESNFLQEYVERLRRDIPIDLHVLFLP